MRETTPEHTKINGERGAVGSPSAGAQIPLQPVVQTMVRQLHSLLEDHGDAEIHLQTMENAECEGLHPVVRDPCWSSL